MKWWLMMLAAVVMSVTFGGKVFAAPCPGQSGGPYGRGWFCSYFTDSYDANNINAAGNDPQASWVFVPLGATQYAGITADWQTVNITLASFVAAFQVRLFDASSPVNEARTAAIVDIMLGRQGPSFGGSPANGIAYAQAHWANWVSLVTDYSSNNFPGYSVNFNFFQDFTNIKSNGYGLVANNPNGRTDCIAPVQCLPDIVFKNNFDDPETDKAVIFYYPGGEFIIKDKCGNLTGDTLPPPLPPTPAPVCSAVSTTPGTIDPQTSFKITAAVDFDNSAHATAAAGAGDKIEVTITGTGYTKTFKNLAPSVALNELSAKTPFVGPLDTGSYTISYNLDNSAGTPLITPACSSAFTVAVVPYFSVSTGDIQAGAPMGLNNPAGGTDCTTVPADPKAGVVSWNQEVSGNYAGAGANFAAVALNYLQDFATAQGSAGGSNLAKQPVGLSFSNGSTVTGSDGGQSVVTSGNGNDTYGGNFGLLSCMPNFTANLGAPQPKGTPAPPSDPNGRVTFYVNGNVHLIDDVAIFNGTYTNLGKIPSYTIISTGGNIYIDSSVTRLDGLYVAEPDSTGKGGTIYTCNFVPSAAVQNGDTNLTVDLQNYMDNCTAPLTINGAFVAKKVELLRTNGSLYEPYGAAETFNFAPELWLGTAYDSTNGGLGQGYDSISSLPPVL